MDKELEKIVREAHSMGATESDLNQIVDTYKKKSISLKGSQIGSKTLPFGSKPFQIQVDTKFAIQESVDKFRGGTDGYNLDDIKGGNNVYAGIGQTPSVLTEQGKVGYEQEIAKPRPKEKPILDFSAIKNSPKPRDAYYQDPTIAAREEKARLKQLQKNYEAGKLDRNTFTQDLDLVAASGIDMLGRMASTIPSGILDNAIQAFGNQPGGLVSMGIDAEVLGKIAEKKLGLPEEYNPLSPNNALAETFRKKAELNQSLSRKGYSGGITDALKLGEYKDAAKLLAFGFTESLPILLGLAATRGSGMSSTGSLISTGLGTQATTYQDLKTENPEIAKNILFLNATLTGIGEAGSEVTGTNLLYNQARKLFVKGQKEQAKEIVTKGIKEYLDYAFQKSFVGSAVLGDMSGEVANQIWKNATDKWSGVRPDVDYLDGVGDAALISAFTTSTIAAGAKSLAAIVNPKTKDKIDDTSLKISNLQKEADNPDMPDAARTVIVNEIGNLTESINEDLKKDNVQYNDLDDDQKTTVDNLSDKRDEIKSALNNAAVSDETKQVLQKQLNDIDLQIESILSTKPTPEQKLETPKPQEDAIQVETAGQVPVLTEATVGEEVEQGKPEPEAEVVAEEGVKAEEVGSGLIGDVVELQNGNKLAINKDRSKLNEYSYDVQDVNGNNLGVFNISDNGEYYQIKNVELKSQRTGLGTEIYETIIKKLDKPLISDPSLTDSSKALWEKLVSKGIAEKYTEKVNVDTDRTKKSFNRERYRTVKQQPPTQQLKAEKPIVSEEAVSENIEQTPAQQVKQLRAEEQAELKAAIPNADQYLTDGKVDKNKLTDPKDKKAFNKIWKKYDKFITPKLKEAKADAEVAELEKIFASITTPSTENKGVSVTNKSVINEVKTKSKDTNKIKVVESAQKLLKTLQSVLPKFDIVIHDNEGSYNSSMSDVNGLANSAGNFSYVKNQDGSYSGRIDINLDKANSRTVAHEVAHGIMLKAFGDNPPLFKNFRDKISKVLSETANKDLMDFANQYKGDVAYEEYLVELSAMLSEQGGKISPTSLQKISAIINDIVSRLTKGAFKPFEDIKNTNDIIDFFNNISESIAKGEEIKLQDKGGEVGTFNISKSKSQIDAPKASDDTRDFVRNLVEDVDLREFNGKSFVTNMYDYTTAGIADLGNGFKINMLGGKNYVPYMMSLQGKKIGDISNLAAFNTSSQAESFVRNAKSGNANLFAPHSGTLSASWQFQQHTFAELVDLILDQGIMKNEELIKTFNKTIESSEANQKAFRIFENKYKSNIKNFDSFESDPKKIVELLDVQNNYSPDLRKTLNNAIAADKTFQKAIGIKNKEEFFNRIKDPLNKNVVGGEIMNVVDFDPNTFKIVKTKPDAIDHHPSFAWTLLAKINGIYQPTSFLKSSDVTDSYTKYNLNNEVISRKASEPNFEKKNVSSSAGAIPKVAEFKEQPTSKSQLGTPDDIKQLISQARSKGFSDNAIETFLKSKGFDVNEIKAQMGKPVVELKQDVKEGKGKAKRISFEDINNLTELGVTYIEESVKDLKDITFEEFSTKLQDEYGQDIPENIIRNIFKKSAAAIKLGVRRTPERIGTGDGVSASLKEVANETAALYQKQDYKEIQDRLDSMSEADKNTLVGTLANVTGQLNAEGNVGVLAAIDLINMYEANGDKAGAKRVFDTISKSATAFAQLLRQYGQLKSSTPQGYVSIIEKHMLDKYDVKLTDVQKQAIEKLYNDSKKAIDIEADALNNLVDDLTDVNYKLWGQTTVLLEDANRRLSDYIESLKPATAQILFQKLTSIVQGDLLTLKSLLVNPVSNAAQAGIKLSGNEVANLFDFIINTTLKTGRTKISGFDPLAIRLGGKAFTRGLSKANRMLIKGATATDLAKIDVAGRLKPVEAWKSLYKTLRGKQAFEFVKTIENLAEGTIGVPANLLLRLLPYGDLPRNEQVKIAKLIEIGRNKFGLKGNQLEAFTLKPDPESLTEAELEGDKSTLQESNKVYRTINDLINSIDSKGDDKFVRGLLSGIKFIVRGTQAPFLKTPINYAFKTIRFTNPIIPYSQAVYHMVKAIQSAKNIKNPLLRESAIRKHQSKLTEYLGEAVIAQSIMSAALILIGNGLVTGSAPEEDKYSRERNLMFQSVGPNMINISGLKRLLTGGDPTYKPEDTAIAYNALGILGAQLGISSNTLTKKEKENIREKKFITTEGKPFYEEDKGFYLTSIVDMLANLPASLNYTLNQGFAQGTGTLLASISDNEYSKWSDQMVKTLVTGLAVPNTVYQSFKAGNDYYRDVYTKDQVEEWANIVQERYGNLEGLPIKYDMFGKPIKLTPEGSNPYVYNVLDIFRTQKILQNKNIYYVFDLYKKTGDMSVIPNSVKDIIDEEGGLYTKLTPDQKSELQRIVGEERAKYLNGDRGGSLSLKNYDPTNDSEVYWEKQVKKLKSANKLGLSSGKRRFEKEILNKTKK